MKKPAIPTLLLIPNDGHLDYAALFAIATAYAHSGLIVSEYGHKNNRIEFTMPAVVCSSFALELFLKFFLMVDRAERGVTTREVEMGHNVPELWKKVTPAHKAVIAGMFRNSSGTPHMNASERRIELFEQALREVGDKPFVQWRYIHELQEMAYVSHQAIALVVDALGYAASHVMKSKRETDRQGSQEKKG